MPHKGIHVGGPFARFSEPSVRDFGAVACPYVVSRNQIGFEKFRRRT